MPFFSSDQFVFFLPLNKLPRSDVIPFMPDVIPFMPDVIPFY